LRPTIVLAALASASLAACGKPAAESADANDPFAGLSAEIATWRTSLEAESPVCREKQGGKGCQDFTVACKRERPLTADDQAKGVTARVAVAMTFNSVNPNAKPGSAFAEFSRAKGTWTRTEPDQPFNMATCQ